MNVNHARVSVQGHMKLLNNHQARYGGAVRLGELTLVSCLNVLILIIVQLYSTN